MKSQLAVGGAIALLLIGVLYFFMSGMGGSIPAPANSATPHNPAVTENKAAEPATGTLMDIVAKGGSSECTVSMVGPPASDGSFFVNNGKVRGDFTATTPAGVIQSHMISDGTTSYVWSSAMKSGIKMKIQKDKPAPTPTAPSASQDPYSQKYTYACKAWIADETKFSLPVDISFTDMSTMMGAPTGTGAALPATNCAVCEKVPASARAQCLAALHCK